MGQREGPTALRRASTWPSEPLSKGAASPHFLDRGSCQHGLEQSCHRETARSGSQVPMCLKTAPVLGSRARENELHEPAT